LIYVFASTELFNSFCYLVTGAKLILDGNGRSRITANQFLNLKIPLPSIDKQKQICVAIENELSKIGFLEEKIAILEEVKESSLDLCFLHGYSEDLFKVPQEVMA